MVLLQSGHWAQFSGAANQECLLVLRKGNDDDDHHFNDDDEVGDDLMVWFRFMILNGEVYIFEKSNDHQQTKSACSSYKWGTMVMMIILMMMMRFVMI